MWLIVFILCSSIGEIKCASNIDRMAYFNGNVDSYIKLGAINQPLRLGGPIGISAWIRPQLFGGTLISFSTDENSQDILGLEYETCYNCVSLDFHSDRIRFDIRYRGGIECELPGVLTVTSNTREVLTSMSLTDEISNGDEIKIFETVYVIDSISESRLVLKTAWVPKNNNTGSFQTIGYKRGAIKSKAAIAINQWTHVGVSYDGHGIGYIAINGESSEQGIMLSSFPETAFVYNFIGWSIYGNIKEESSSARYVGYVDDILVWKRHLSLIQIRDIMSCREDSIDTSLFFGFIFDNHDGNMLSDESSNNVVAELKPGMYLNVTSRAKSPAVPFRANVFANNESSVYMTMLPPRCSVEDTTEHFRIEWSDKVVTYEQQIVDILDHSNEVHVLQTLATEQDEIQIIETSAQDIPEVQKIETFSTTAYEVQTIQTFVDDILTGSFALVYTNSRGTSYTTAMMPHAIGALGLEEELEKIQNIDDVRVSRSGPFGGDTFIWTITFSGSLVGGNLPSLTASPVSLLHGQNARIEFQTIREGNEIGGSFKISFGSLVTSPLAYDVAATGVNGMELAIEALDGVGDVVVTRTGPSAEKAYSWTITFVSAVGNLKSLCVDGALLTGIGSVINVTTVSDRNVLSGFFFLLDGDLKSKALSYDVGATAVELELLKLPGVGRVVVRRTGPSQDHGYTWRITFITKIGKQPLLKSISKLGGVGASIEVRRHQQGNSLSGYMTIASPPEPLPGFLTLSNKQFYASTSIDLRPHLRRGDILLIPTNGVEKEYRVHKSEKTEWSSSLLPLDRQYEGASVSNIRVHFRIFSDPILYNASANEIEVALEKTNFFGGLTISRSTRSRVNGYNWSITYVGRAGTVTLLYVDTSMLLGDGAKAVVRRAKVGRRKNEVQRLSLIGLLMEKTIRILCNSEISSRLHALTRSETDQPEDRGHGRARKGAHTETV